jgi:CBS domain-containing protein
MQREIMDEEFKQMYEESFKTSNVLDESTVRAPIRHLNLPKPILLEEGSSTDQALKLMKKHRFGCMLIVKNGRLTGIFTERDVLMKIVGNRFDLENTPVETFMTRNPECLHSDDMIAFALNCMHTGGFRHIPLVDDEHRPVGVVSVKDIVDYLVEHFSVEVLNLPPKPIRVTTVREGA